MKITIEETINGAVVKYPEGKVVYKFEDIDDLEGLQELLYTLSEKLNSSGKYDEKKIEISIVHGSKYECHNKKKCPICKK